MIVGHIKLHRKMLGWDWYKDTNTKCLFIHLLLKANWEDGHSYGVPVKRGQVLTGRRKLAQELGMTEREIRTAISRLQTTHELTSKATNKYSVITIVNYDKYQHCVDDERPAKRPTKRKQTTTIKEDKKEEDKNKDKTYRPDFISEHNWNALIDHRKKHPKKPVHSERSCLVLANKIKTCLDAGYSEDDIVDTIVGRNWQTIELEWMKNTKNQQGTPRAVTVRDALTLQTDQISRRLNEEHDRASGRTKGNALLGD